MDAALGSGVGTGSEEMDSPGLFLGALASEINEPDELAPAFSILMGVTENVLRSYRRGELEENVAAEYLRALCLVDENGLVWRVGASSLRWYRRQDDSTWWFGFPPTEDHDSHQTSLQAALDQVPETFWQSQAGDYSDTAGMYGHGLDDGVEQAPVEPWGYAPGGERQTQSWGS